MVGEDGGDDMLTALDGTVMMNNRRRRKKISDDSDSEDDSEHVLFWLTGQKLKWKRFK